MKNTSHDPSDSKLGHEIASAWELAQRGIDEPIACVLAVQMLGAEHEGRFCAFPVIPVPASTPTYSPLRPLVYASYEAAALDWDPFVFRSQSTLAEIAREIAVF